MEHSQIKNYLSLIKLRKIAIAATIIGFMSALLAVTLKHVTEQYESKFFTQASQSVWLMLLFPLVGLSLIYLLRQYLFEKKPNKGITEIFESTNSKTKNLPAYKIPSHFFNGFLTVVFGGSTGIEVSTVVASAAIGSVAQQKANFFREYKTELICAGVAAGITALFNSPIAGLLFTYEVISRKISKVFALATLIAVTVASVLIYTLNEQPLFAIQITGWHYRALPYFLLLGILAGLHSIYLTRCVLFFKKRFSKIEQQRKILTGAAILSTALLVFPQLYGDGYHAIKEVLLAPQQALTTSFAITIIGLLLLKPIVTSATLASGGDGGVFAPSLFIGAFLGLILAVSVNAFFGAAVIPVNFMIIGMAAVLSASIHAPFTAVFLVCGLVGDYMLFFPILAACLISKYTAKAIYPHTVYTFSKN
jgi:chloride channel protein, CIC family